ncbi:nucleotide-binding protein [Stenotrophomonas acidaminiphila]|uniref:nucleotide-binding protein n=1 Tax=Stenotrophomonas acidaminiphila TaxID=128780 RepID=UPI0020C72571|nr:nucleotide-binding protein [Stenotrophomonas acidaminiphila]MDF9440702.1 nucleotide-binding protein [Stenotrophomonas acidaminiphila]
MTIELQRTEEQYLALQATAVDRELERAAAGLPPPTVSTKAAAKFLGVHFDTLGEWRRRSPPLGPPFQKGAGQVGGGLNQHVRYLYSDLVEWQQARIGKSAKERRLQNELDQAQQRLREHELELALRQAKDELAKLQKKLGRIAALVTLQDVAMETHDWALIGDRIAGHVLAIDDATLAQALAEGDVWEGSVQDALAQPWTSTENRQPYQDAFLGVLAATQHAIEAARSRQRASDLEERLSSDVVESAGIRPFGKGSSRL